MVAKLLSLQEAALPPYRLQTGRVGCSLLRTLLAKPHLGAYARSLSKCAASSLSTVADTLLFQLSRPKPTARICEVHLERR